MREIFRMIGQSKPMDRSVELLAEGVVFLVMQGPTDS